MSPSAPARLTVLALALALAPAALAAGAGRARGKPRAAEHKTHVVRIEAMKFTPAEVEIELGDTVVWENHDILPHNVSELGRSFDSGMILVGKSWSLTPKAKGTFKYLCSYHPVMKGAVVVK